MSDTGTPSALPDGALVEEDGALVALGSVLGNDADPEGDPLFVVSVNGKAVAPGGSVVLVGAYGTLEVHADGSYSYTLANDQANVQVLGDGDTPTEVFRYTLSDGQQHFAETGFAAANLIAQSEAFDGASWTRFAAYSAAPTVTADVALDPFGATMTADRLNLSAVASGVYTPTAALGEHTFSVWARLASGDGHFSFNYWNGGTNAFQAAEATSEWQRFSFTFTGNGGGGSNVAIMHDFAQGAAGVLELWGAQINAGPDAQVYLPTSGAPVVTTGPGLVEVIPESTLTVTIQGADEGQPPSALPDGALVEEDGALVALGSVLGNDADPEGDPLFVVSVNGKAVAPGGSVVLVGAYGTLEVHADGSYSYTLANDQANVQVLGDGDTPTEVFRYTLSDGQQHFAETGFAAANLIAQSEAFDGASWTRFAAYSAAPTVTADVALDPFGATMTADRLNLSAVASGVYTPTAALGEHTFSVWARLASGDGHFSFNYWNGGTNAFQAAEATSEWQRFSFTFTGNGGGGSNVAIMHDFAQGAAGVLELWGAQINAGPDAQVYLPTSGAPVVTTGPGLVEVIPESTLTVTIQGADEGQPPSALPDGALVEEDGALVALGSVLGNDADPEGDPLFVVSVNGKAVAPGGSVVLVGAYGTLEVHADGSYSYTLANDQANVQVLGDGDTPTEVFRYTLSDGQQHFAETGFAAANLIAQSEAFDGASWTRFAAYSAAPTVTADVALDPFGATMTADRLNLSAVASGVYTPTAALGEHTFSVWARLASGDGHFSFNYWNGGTNAFQAAEATSEWQRFSFTFTGNGGGGSNVAIMHDFAQGAAGVLELWGAQINAGPDAQVYLPTSGAPVVTTGPGLVEVIPESTLTVTIQGESDAGLRSFAALNEGVVANLSTREWARVMKIIPLGDSITYGWRLEDELGIEDLSEGYRGPLWRDFVAQDQLVQFVGPERSGSQWLLSPDHAGFPGERADQLALRADEIALLVPDLLDQERGADAILMMVGTNDTTQESVPQASVGIDIRTMLDIVAAERPSIHVYVATLPPIDPAQTNPALIPAVNDIIRATVAQAIADGLNVSLVENELTLGDLYDGKHPSEEGYAKLAETWMSAILATQPAVGGTPGGVLRTLGAAIVSLEGSEFNDLLIGDARDNRLVGGSGNDRVDGRGGQDSINGGAGMDQFAFKPLPGSAVIEDFNAAQHDGLVFEGFAGLGGIAELTPLVSHAGADTRIDMNPLGVALTITLKNYVGILDDMNVWIA